MTTPTRVVTVGADLLADAVAAQAVAVTRVDWRPPMPGTEADLATVAADPLRPTPTPRALERDARRAGARWSTSPRPRRCSASSRGQFLHAGPPIAWDRASGPLRGALMGGAALEGLVDDPEDAVALFEAGTSCRLEPCHHRGAVGPMAGVVTPSMWMFVLEDPATGAPHLLLAQRGARQGAAVRRLRPRGARPAALDGRRARAAAAARPSRGARTRSTSPAILTQMLQMGDEAHNRNRAGTLMLLRDLGPAPWSPAAPTPPTSRRRCGSSAATTTSSSTSRCPPASSRSTRPAASTGSTMVVAMARNGTDFGIQVAGTGDEWFTGPAQVADGLFLGDYGPDDANPDIGDSAITETAGIGGFAMATAPAIVRFVGGSVPDALATTRRMHEITLGENPRWTVPVLEFQGAPTGIDVTRVCRTGILPADQHRHGRQAAPASARSAPAWSPRPPRSSRRRSPGSRSSPGRAGGPARTPA